MDRNTQNFMTASFMTAVLVLIYWAITHFWGFKGAIIYISIIILGFSLEMVKDQ
jgi:glycerol uptake facilitator-like aquaporin